VSRTSPRASLRERAARRILVWELTGNAGVVARSGFANSYRPAHGENCSVNGCTAGFYRAEEASRSSADSAGKWLIGSTRGCRVLKFITCTQTKCLTMAGRAPGSMTCDGIALIRPAPKATCSGLRRPRDDLFLPQSGEGE